MSGCGGGVGGGCNLGGVVAADKATRTFIAPPSSIEGSHSSASSLNTLSSVETRNCLRRSFVTKATVDSVIPECARNGRKWEVGTKTKKMKEKRFLGKGDTTRSAWERGQGQGQMKIQMKIQMMRKRRRKILM